MSKKDDEGSLIIRILSHKDIQKSIAFFSVALILAFSAVITVEETDVTGGEVGIDDKGIVSIYYPGMREVHNATLKIVGDEEARTNFSLEITNFEFETLWRESYELDEGEKVEESLPDLELDEGDPRYLDFNVSEGNLTYNYRVTYPKSPYGFLSLPAMFFVIVGMVFGFRGKGVILGEIKQRQMEEKQQKEESEKRKDISKERETLEPDDQEMIYEGDAGDQSKEDRAGADHIDFMGIPDEEDKDDDKE